MTTENSQADPVVKLSEEFIEQFRLGLDPRVDDYAEKFPEYADRIRDLFPALLLMEKLAPASDGEIHPLGDSERAREQIGSYRLLREIGRGGMGVVYEAEQVSLRRRVALKVLPTGPVSKRPSALKRFQSEAQSAARLNHPNIVPVYEVGEDRSCWYYAMQLISGLGLDEVLAELNVLRGQSQTSDRTEVAETTDPDKTILAPAMTDGQLSKESTFASVLLPGDSTLGDSETNRSRYFRSVTRIGVEVAQALHHAHEQGIVHRDIKPSNLLLDMQSKIWVTDFGLAKSEGDGLTRTGDIVGTLRYMAPERFRGQSDARSDVYSLGMTLYEMLVLRPVFNHPDRLQLIDQVIHEPPPLPRSLDAKIPRELETIILKAISKEPENRYSTAQELADDLQRFLDDRPISARRSSSAERTVRWCRRNPAVAGLIAAVWLALVTGCAVSFQMWREAQQQANQAADNYRLAFQSVNQFFTMFSKDPRLHEPALQPLRRKLLRDCLTNYEVFLRQRNDDQQLQRELAIAHRAVGSIHRDLGATELALESYATAHRILLENQQDRTVRRLIAATLQDQASMMLDQGRYADCKQRINRALTYLPDLRSMNESERYVYAVTRSNLGVLECQFGNPRGAREILTDAVDLWQGLLREFPGSYQYHERFGRCLSLLGNAQRELGDYLAAEQSFLQSIDAFEMSPGRNGEFHTLSMHYLVELFVLTDQPQRAFDRARPTIAVMERLLERDPENQVYRAILCRICRLASQSLHSLRQPEESMKYLQKAIAVSGEPDPMSDEPRKLVRLTDYKQLMAAFHEDLGDRKKARRFWREAIQLNERLVQRGGELPLYQSELAKSVVGLALLEEAEGAKALLERAIQVRESLVQRYPDTVRHHANLASSYCELGNFYTRNASHADAIECFLKAISVLERDDFVGSSVERRPLATCYHNLSLVYRKIQNPDEAARSLEEALRIRRDLAQRHPDNPALLHDLAATYYTLAHSEDSREKKVELYQKAIEIWEPRTGTTDVDVMLAGAYCNLAVALCPIVRSIDDGLAEVEGYQERAATLLEPIVQRDSEHETARQFFWNVLSGGAGLHVAVATQFVQDQPEEQEKQLGTALNYLLRARRNGLITPSRGDFIRETFSQLRNRPGWESFWTEEPSPE